MMTKHKNILFLMPVYLLSCSGGSGGTPSWPVPVSANGSFAAYASGTSVIHYDAAIGVRREITAVGSSHGVTVTPDGTAVFFFADKGSYESTDGKSRERRGLYAWYPGDSGGPIEMADYAEDYEVAGDFGHLLARYYPGGRRTEADCNALVSWDVRARLAVEIDRCVDKAGNENIVSFSPDSRKFVYIKSDGNFLYDFSGKTKTPLGKSYAVFSADSKRLAYCIINPADSRAGGLRLLGIEDGSDMEVDGHVPLSASSTVGGMQKFSSGGEYLFYPRDKGGTDTELVQYEIATGGSSVAVGGAGAAGVEFQAAGNGGFLVYMLGSMLYAYDYTARVSRLLHNGWDSGFLISPDGKNLLLLRQYVHNTQAWPEETAGDIETVAVATGEWKFISDNAVFGFYRPERKYGFNPAGDGLVFMAAERYAGGESHYLGLWDFNSGVPREIRAAGVYDYRQDAVSGVITYSVREAGAAADTDAAALYYNDPAGNRKSVRVGTICTGGCRGFNPRMEGLFRIDGGYISYSSQEGVFVYDIKTGKNTKL